LLFLFLVEHRSSAVHFVMDIAIASQGCNGNAVSKP
jgi:hypothetical protein